MKKICLAIVSVILIGSLSSCDKDCSCSIIVEGVKSQPAVVGQMSKEECDTFFWAVPAGSTYTCQSE
ncbi:MAG: hypothetical protein LBV02_04465 [Bacteroidales bacterium]|nr:hypothetical protein [Bacteroidales bacterium]